MNIAPSSHPWDESHLIMVYDLPNGLLNLNCQYFVEDFSIYVHQRYRSVVFCLCHLYLALELGWHQPHKKCLGVFFPLEFFGIV